MLSEVCEIGHKLKTGQLLRQELVEALFLGCGVSPTEAAVADEPIRLILTGEQIVTNFDPKVNVD